MAERERLGKATAKTFMGAATGARVNRLLKVAAVPMNAVDSNGGVFAWANPEGVPILIDSVVLDITTPSGAACSVSVGTGATATSYSANLIDTASVAAATQVDNFSNKGTNGRSSGKVSAGQFVTGSKITGLTAGLAGMAYISYLIA